VLAESAVRKRKANLSRDQRFRLRDLLCDNLKAVRAYLLKEDFQQFWQHNSPAWAAKFLDDWCDQVMRSRIEPMKKIAIAPGEQERRMTAMD
jgi:transposase